MTNIQRTVDAYASMGLPALEKMKRTNPKLLAAIAQENLEQTVAASGNNKAMAMGGAKPTVTDRKLGLAGLPGLGQREALGAAAPGIRQRGRQLQANQLARALQQSVRRPAGGITSMPLMRSGMRRFDEGGNVSAGLPAIGKGQPIPMLMQKYGSEKVMEFLKKEKELKDIEGNVAPELRKDFEMMKANMESLFDPKMIQDIRRTRSGPDEVQLAGGGEIQKFDNGGEIVGYDEQGNPLTRDQLTEEQLKILQREEEFTARGTVTDPVTGVLISQADLQADRNQGLTNPEITEQVRRQNFPNRGEQFVDRTRQVIDVSPFNPVQSVREGFYEVTQPGSLGERFGRGLEKFGEGVVGSLVYGSAPTIAAGEQTLGQAADVGRGFFTTGAVGESVEAAQEAIEERAELTRQRNNLTEQLRQINLQLQAPGLEAPDIERLQNARNELSQQLENVNNRRTELVDESIVARGLDALPSVEDLRNFQQFLANTPIGQRLLAENANRQDQREKTEIERRQAEELERLEAGLTPGQKATRALQQGRPQDLFFPREEKEEKGAQPSARSDLADSVLTFLQNLGYGSGASKGTVGSTYFKRRSDAEEAQAARQADVDALDKRLAGALEVMREEQQIRGDQAAAIAVAGYRADLENNPSIVQSRAEYLKGKAEIEAELGDTFLASPFGDPNKEAREAALAALEARVRDKMVREYTATLQPTASGDTVDYTELLQETSN